MSQKDGMNTDDLDPFGPWRSFRDATIDVWAKSMAEAVNTEAFAQNMGAYLNTYLATSAPLQKFVEQYMEATLSRLSMPSRDEVIDLARRMTSIEMRLDDLDAKTDQLVHTLRGRSTPSNGVSHELAGLTGRIEQVEARAGELLSLMHELRDQLPTATAATSAPQAELARPPASRRSRTRKTTVDEPSPAEKTAEDVADDVALEPFQNADA